MKKQSKVLIIVFYVTLSMIFTQNIYAHPGRTASDGCHYCRTNCAKWGEVEGARHCHGGGSSAPSYNSTPVNTQPTCPANSTYDSLVQRCSCNYDYAPSLDKAYCVKIPANAHSVNSLTDVWECNYGYEEINNACVAVKVEKPAEVIGATSESTERSFPPTPRINKNIYNADTPVIATSDESDSTGTLGLLTIGGIYVGKKLLDSLGSKTKCTTLR